MAEAPTHTGSSMMQLFSDWEIHVLILWSFALQVFLFFSGGLRRRNSHMMLRITIWLSYLSADFIAAYALGHLSRNLPTSSTTNENHEPVSHQLTILWAPFLLIHLGGQDTVTAFSLEDNELWLRHLLNLLGQACLVVYVLWKWVALAQYQLVIPAAFLFVAGIIKYGERIWALKLGSLRKLASRGDVIHSSNVRDKMGRTYQEIISYARYTEDFVRDIFAGSKLGDMKTQMVEIFVYPISSMEVAQALGEEAQLNFKRIEIELCRMYDNLFTKSRVIQSKAGAILRCVSLASTVVAFVLYVKMIMSIADAEQTYRSRVDAAITYILFIGAFCLEACSFFMVMMSPWQWPVMEGRAGWWCRARAQLLNRVAWPIFVRIQPETKPWWSNSMGQYNLVAEWDSAAQWSGSKWSSCTVVMAKMAGIFGASELWNKISNTKHAEVTREIKELIHDSIDTLLLDGTLCIRVPSAYGYLLSLPFERTLLLLHLWTDVVVDKAAACKSEEEEVAVARRRRLMDTCKRLSNYMVYLLMEHPAMLSVGSGIHLLLARAHQSWYHRESFRSSLEHATESPYRAGYFWSEQRAVLQNEGNIHAELEILEKVWVRMLLYAAGKSRPEEHARRLSTGGELITLVWLLMARRGLGDVNAAVGLTAATGSGTNRARHLMEPIPRNVS